MRVEEWLDVLPTPVELGTLAQGDTFYHDERVPEFGRAGIVTESAAGDPPGTVRVAYFGTGRSEYQPHTTMVRWISYRAVVV